jgi:hypothetical protein
VVAGRTVIKVPAQIKRNAFWFASVGLLLLAASVEWRYGDPTSKDILGWLGVIASSFSGALIAFAFNAVRVRSDREEREFIAGNLALMILTEMWDRLLQYNSVFVQPVRDKRDAWFSMRPGPLINVDLKIDKASLAFLLGEHTTAWRSVVLEETRFNVLNDAVVKRNKMFNDIVWPKTEAAGLGHGQSIETSAITKILGPGTTQDLKNSTAFIINDGEKDIQSMEACIANLRRALVEIFPNKKFVQLPARLPPRSVENS